MKFFKNKDKDAVNITWKYGTPLKELAAVEMLEIKHHFRLPDDLKQCIYEHNGATPEPSKFDSALEKDRLFGGLLSFNEGDPDNIYDFIGLFLLNTDTNASNKTGLKMFPFGLDPFGNFYCIEADHISVVFYNHETNRAEVVAKSFTDFLKLLHK